VSNPDLPGPYWQDQDGAGYDAGWRGVAGSPPRVESPWDDGNAGFWRNDRGNGRNGGRSGDQNGAPGSRADSAGSGGGRAGGRRIGSHGIGRGVRGRGAGDTGAAERDSSWPDMLAGRSGRAAQRGSQPRDDWDADSGGNRDRGGRFSQTADELRSRLGVRGSAGGRSRGRANGSGRDGAGLNGDSTCSAGSNGARPDDDFWSEPAGRRGSRDNGSRDNGSRDNGSPDGSRADGGSRRLSRAGAAGVGGGAGANGAARADGAAAYPGEPGGYSSGGHGSGGYGGPGGYGDDGRNDGRTALRDQPDEFWADGDRTSRTTRSRVTDRPDVRRGGGSGGGGGRGGGRGGRPEGGDPRSGGERFKDWLLYGSWWRHWTWKKLFMVLCGSFAAFVLLVLIGIGVAYSKTPIPTDVSQTVDWQSSSVYFSNGQLLGTFTNSQDINRQLLTESQIPQNVENAIIAAEDRNFYHEGGISVSGIARAAKDDLFGSGGLQGGSTITEQYAKNYYSNIGASRTFTTKIKEIFVAVKLAHSRSKAWILNNYLNTVPFGANIYGVWAAAEDYFGIDLAKSGTTLTTAQAAMLGAMPNQPGYFSPDPAAGGGYTALVQRWQYVLTNMLRDGAISQQDANSLCASCALQQAEKVFNASIQLHQSSGNGWTGTNAYLMGMVEQELESTYRYTTTQIDTGGLRITTTFSPSMMHALNKAVNTEKRQMAASGVPLPNYDHFGISLENPKTGAIIAIYGGPGVSLPNAVCARLFCDYNMAEAPHPVGSSMKPYVLAAAIDQDMDVQNSVLNGYSPLWIPPEATMQDRLMLSQQQPPAGGATLARSEGWWESVGDAPLGPVSVAKAAALSSDPAFTDLTHRVGDQAIISAAQAFGVGADPFNLGPNDLTTLNKLFGPNGSIPGSVQIALGQGDLTPIEQASTFATLIDDGLYHAPHVISKLSQSTSSGQQPVQLKIASHQVMSSAAAADEDYALSFDNVYGTAYPNATWPGRPVIGKTGTLGNGTDASEAWFVGAIPQYSMAVGLWTNTQGQNLDNLSSLGGVLGSYGGAWPAATWQTLMTTQFGHLPVENLPTPNYAGFVKWVQVAPKKAKQMCRPGQFQNCTCPHGQNCQNPNPNHTPCPPGVFGQNCGGGGPTPTPTPTPTPCFGQQCSPSPTPTVTPCTKHPCTGALIEPATTGGALTTPSANQTAALTVVLSPAEEVVLARSRGIRLLL
jgi:membrane peptidoglycan carboxypeptidase